MLEHLGIAVRDADAASDLFRLLLGFERYKVERVEREGVATHFLDAGTTKIELLEATRPDSPVAAFLEKRGEGLHHVAFGVRDLAAEMARLRAAGIPLLADAPKRGADGQLICFLHPKATAGVLVELCEYAPEPLVPEWVGRRSSAAGAGRLAAYALGPEDAPPLLALHSAAGSAELDLRRLAAEWTRHHRVLLVDFSGHGRSDAFAGAPFTFAHFIEDAVAALDHFGVAQADVFGFSMGGGVALGLASQHPERVRRLAVHGVNVQWDEDEARQMVQAMEPETIRQHAPRWAGRLADTHSADLSGAARWPALMRQMQAFTRALPARPFPDQQLAAIAHPTLVSHGDADRYFALRHALHLRETLPDARLAVHPGLDHPIQGADPRRFAALVHEHLQRR